MARALHVARCAPGTGWHGPCMVRTARRALSGTRLACCARRAVRREVGTILARQLPCQKQRIDDLYFLIAGYRVRGARRTRTLRPSNAQFFTCYAPWVFPSSRRASCPLAATPKGVVAAGQGRTFPQVPQLVRDCKCNLLFPLDQLPHLRIIPICGNAACESFSFVPHLPQIGMIRKCGSARRATP